MKVPFGPIEKTKKSTIKNIKKQFNYCFFLFLFCFFNVFLIGACA